VQEIHHEKRVPIPAGHSLSENLEGKINKAKEITQY